MFDELDGRTRLSRRQRLLAYLATWAVCLEFLDYFLIGFILTFVSGEWALTFGQSSVILLSSGVGAILGAIYFGRLADRIGRRRVFLITIAVFTLATGALALTPDDPTVGWLYLTVLRVVVGFGAGGLYVVDLPMVQEFMPAAKRGRVTGMVTSAVPLGFLVGSLLVWLLSDAIGWRGILVVATVMGLSVFALRLWIPESPRYLARQGDLEGARRSIAWALHVDPQTLPVSAPPAEAPRRRAGIRELLPYRRSFWLATVSNLGTQTGYYGLTLWTPTLLVLILGVDSAKSGFYLVFVTLGALAGRFGLSYLAEAVGRRRAGTIAGFAAAALLVVAASLDQVMLAGVSVFFLLMIVVYFFGEGGFAIVGPYSGEVWPSYLRTTGMGFAYGIGGIGKVIGPLGLGLIVGSDNLVEPAATLTDLLPAFCYFAGWYALCAVMFALLGFETKGKSLEQLDREIEGQRGQVVGSQRTSANDGREPMAAEVLKAAALGRSEVTAARVEVSDTVQAVIEDIRTRGDDAVREYSKRFDDWSPDSFLLSAEQVEAAVARLPDEVVRDIETVQGNVRRFAKAQRESMAELEVETAPGVHLGQKHIPVAAAGAYVPGGRYPLTASAHMTIVTAKAAGVPRVAACTPPIRGQAPDATIAAMHLAGADEIYLLGGVQAVAALSLGTETIDKVDLLAGPGNAYVAEAKRQLFGEVGIDLLAGPTETLIVADASADPFVVAVDLLSQAEHGPDSPAVLITTSRDLAEAALRHIDELLPGMPTKDFAAPAWRDYGQVHVVDTLEAAYGLADTFASEHVQILTEQPRRALDEMRNFGAIFLGEGTCVSYGDKVIGTNHVLPTLGAARYTGGLWVGKYLKTVTYQEITDPAASASLGELCGRAARVEEFEGHARSGDVRAAKYAGKPLPWSSHTFEP